jgi:hypothetical protein
MSSSICFLQPKHHSTITAHSQGSLILQLPIDILKEIGRWVATGENPEESAKHAISWSRVCILTHILCHDYAIEKSIHFAKLGNLTENYIDGLFNRKMPGAIPCTNENVQLEKLRQSTSFYNAFKEATIKYNIKENSDEFMKHFCCLVKKLRVQFHKKSDFFSNPLNADIENGVSPIIQFSKFLSYLIRHAIKDMVDDYTNQPLSEITIENFKEKSKYIAKTFPDISEAFIEANMRQAVLAKHSKEKFQSIIDQVSRQKVGFNSSSIEKITDFYRELSITKFKNQDQIRRYEALHQIFSRA